MLRFNDAPIKQKLVVATIFTTGLALLLAGLGSVLVDAFLFRSYLRRDLTVIARIIADNSTATLQFDDAEAAAQILAALRARPHVTGACVYTRPEGQTSKLFAQYRAEARFTCPSTAELGP